MERIRLAHKLMDDLYKFIRAGLRLYELVHQFVSKSNVSD